MKRIEIAIVERNGEITKIEGPSVYETLDLGEYPKEKIAELTEQEQGEAARMILVNLFKQPATMHYKDREGGISIIHTDDIRGARFTIFSTDEPEPTA